METNYVNVLMESLEKKLALLRKIREKDAGQLELIKKDTFPFEQFDKNTEEKGILIYQLNKLDEGFEILYARVRDELNQNKPQYEMQIGRMQDLIRQITEQSVSIQAEESRNKSALELKFKNERNKLRGNRNSANAAKSYTQTMNRTYADTSKYMDWKK